MRININLFIDHVAAILSSIPCFLSLYDKNNYTNFLRSKKGVPLVEFIINIQFSALHNMFFIYTVTYTVLFAWQLCVYRWKHLFSHWFDNNRTYVRQFVWCPLENILILRQCSFLRFDVVDERELYVVGILATFREGQVGHLLLKNCLLRHSPFSVLYLLLFIARVRVPHRTGINIRRHLYYLTLIPFQRK